MIRTLPEQDSFPPITSVKPWLVCFVASLFFFYEFIQLNMFNAIDSGLVLSFHLNAEQLGTLGGASLIANVLFLFPAGLLLDRFSTRRLILLTLSLCVLGTVLFSQASSLESAWFYRFITGIGSAFCFLSCVRLASRWFSARHLAFIVGLVVTMAMLGGFIAQTPFTVLVEHYGWRHTLLLDAGMGGIFLVLIALLVEDYPVRDGQDVDSLGEQARAVPLRTSLGLALMRRQNWLGGIYTCLMNLPIVLLGAVWGMPYLHATWHLSETDASIVLSMIFLGTIIGSPVMGWLSDLLERRRGPMRVGSVLSLLVMLLIIYWPAPEFHTLVFLFLLLGFISSTQVISYPTVAESNPALITATAVSVVSFTTQGLGAFFQHLYGWMLVKNWGGKYLEAGVPSYSATAHHHAILILPIGFLVAFFAASLINETYCRPPQESSREFQGTCHE